MATITGLTAERMLEIEGASIIDGEIVGGNLILTKHDGTTINAGSVSGPAGPTGPEGPPGGLIPGEMRLWPGGVLPDLATYGRWVWADGAVYVVATYPLAAAHIAPQWRNFGGASDPGVLNFRVPDFRGVVPAGLDAMPDGSGGHGTRANRMTRSVAIILAGKTGEETHIVTIAETPPHGHGGGNHGHVVVDPGHDHPVNDPGHGHDTPGQSSGPSSGLTNVVQDNGGPPDHNIPTDNRPTGITIADSVTGISINGSGAIIAVEGGGGAHENVQPTVFVPWIVKLDD